MTLGGAQAANFSVTVCADTGAADKAATAAHAKNCFKVFSSPLGGSVTPQNHFGRLQAAAQSQRRLLCAAIRATLDRLRATMAFYPARETHD